MKAITAVPATVEEIFQKEYSIPNFQRPYSWEADVECAKLWEDILDFYETRKPAIDKYFLGNILVNPSSNLEIPTLEVLDKQQRLITITLFIKALFDNASNSKLLDGCLKMKNPLTGNVIDELEKLLERTIKYVFAKSIIGKSADIKWATFRAYVKIQHGRDYAGEYKLTASECLNLSAWLDESHRIVKSCKRGIIYLSAYLNNRQNIHDFSRLLSVKVEIEHILPRAWNNYDT